jgi:hypothetical protein
MHLIFFYDGSTRRKQKKVSKRHLKVFFLFNVGNGTQVLAHVMQVLYTEVIPSLKIILNTENLECFLFLIP